MDYDCFVFFFLPLFFCSRGDSLIMLISLRWRESGVSCRFTIHFGVLIRMTLS